MRASKVVSSAFEAVSVSPGGRSMTIGGFGLCGIRNFLSEGVKVGCR
jgi:hypothetical protein